MIENKERRTLNFLFVNPFPIVLNEFSNRLRKFFDNKLDEYVTEMDTRINSFIDKLRNDELEEDENEANVYPISTQESPHVTFDISSVGRIALATADDPFFKLAPSHKKYFPELVVYNKHGKIVELIDETKSGSETETKGSFESNCRDAKLKVNDDRKASISLMLQKDVQMVLLVVRSKDLSEQTDVKKEEFDRAQFRFIDDETNQSLDTAQIKNIKITLPTPEGEGDEEQIPEPEMDEDGDDESHIKKPQNVIVVGRVFLENGRWIYEQYHYMFKEDKHPDFFEKMGQLEAESRNYFKEKEAQIKEEEKLLKESKEAAAQAAAAKAASKKGKKKEPSTSKTEKEEKVDLQGPEEEENKLDIENMPGFKKMIEGVYSTVFGPITLELTEEKWNQSEIEKLIKKKMTSELGDKIKNCIHGFEFKILNKINGLSRKRVLNASRNVQNLQILPIIPPEKEVEELKPEGEGQEEGDSDNE